MSLSGILAVVVIAVWFLWMASPGLVSGFSHDDLMNAAFALRDGWGKVLRGNLLFYSTQYRPFGGLFYLSLYELFGWTSLPYRVVAFAALGANLFLLYRLARALTNSAEAGLIAALLIAWHGNFSPLFFGSGNCYDVFAFTFYIGALLYYVRARQRGPLRVRQLAVMAVLQICAMNSKEVSASLPLVLLSFEGVFHWPRGKWLSWPSGDGRGVMLSALLSGVYTIGKIVGPDALVTQSAYAPSLSLTAYLKSAVSYLNDLLYRGDFGSETIAVICLAGLFVIALVLKDRSMLFAGCLVVLAPLPAMLIQPRGLASHYISLGGLAIWMAILLVEVRHRFARMIRARPWEERYLQAVLFGLLTFQLARFHLPYRQPQIDAWRQQQLPIRQATASMQAHPEWWSDRSAALLVKSDPFPDFRWAPVFIAILVSGNPNIIVHRPEDLGTTAPDHKVRLDWRGSEWVAEKTR